MLSHLPPSVTFAATNCTQGVCEEEKKRPDMKRDRRTGEGVRGKKSDSR